MAGPRFVRSYYIERDPSDHMETKLKFSNNTSTPGIQIRPTNVVVIYIIFELSERSLSFMLARDMQSLLKPTRYSG